MRPGLVATVRTLASMQQLHKQVQQKEQQKQATNVNTKSTVNVRVHPW